MSDTKALELVGLIYDAAGDPDLWPVFLERLAEAVRGDGTVLFAVEPEAPLRAITAMTRFDPVLIDRYAREFGDNIWVRRADERFEIDEIRYSQGLTSTSELQRDRYYADFLYPAEVAHSLGLKIPFGGSLPAYLASCRSSRMAPFEPEEGNLFLAVQPHVRRALELHRQVAGNLAFENLLQTLAVGIAFANESGQLIWWNRYVDSIFNAKDGLTLNRSRFQTALRHEEQRLGALIEQAATLGSKKMPGGGAMAVSRPSMRQAYALLVSPLKKGRAAVKRAVVAILITDPERSLPPGMEQRLAQQFGLTPAEARVATQLVQGNSVETAADSLSIATATARTHVRNLLLKTNTKRQAELIKVLLSGPSLLEFD